MRPTPVLPVRIRAAAKNMRMQTRFMLTFGSVVITLMVIVVVFAAQRQSRTAVDQIEKRGLTIAQSLATASTPSLLTYDYSSLQRLADDIQAQTGAVYVIVHDKEQAVGAFSGRPEQQWKELDDPLTLWALSRDAPAVRKHDGRDLGTSGDLRGPALDVLEVAMPVRLDDDTTRWGTVRVGLSLGELHAQVAATVRDLTLLGVFAVVVVLLSARVFTNRITEPLRQLSEAAARVADGELGQSLDEELAGELGDAAKSFNKMTQDLRRSHDAIRYQKQHLENMVQERTGALRQKARELEKANRELKEVDRLKSDFLSNVSHELRTPLTSIRSFTEILADGMAVTPEEQSEFLSIIASQTDRLTRLIGDLLDLSKIEAGEFYCNLDTVSLDALVLAPSVETVQHAAHEASIAIEAAIDDDLPDVFGDGDRLSQVTMNLLDNAIKFTPAGGHIVVRATRSPVRVPSETIGSVFHGVESDTPESGDYVVIAIEDDGCGIPPEDQQRVFEKFGQVGNVLTSKPQGTGLGLAISANIMVQHGGALWLHSTPGEGSTFVFSVPVSAAGTTPAETRSDSGGRTRVDAVPTERAVLDALQRIESGTKVLVVDDDPDHIARITRPLEESGFRALGCEGGIPAVENARELDPDAIVLPSALNDLNGYEVLRRLRHDPRTCDVPVILIGPADEARKAYELGADVHVARVDTREHEMTLPV